MTGEWLVVRQADGRVMCDFDTAADARRALADNQEDDTSAYALAKVWRPAATSENVARNYVPESCSGIPCGDTMALLSLDDRVALVEAGCALYAATPVRPVEGGERITEVVATEREVVVLGVPREGDEAHNCDAMGCGQCHVLARHRLIAPPAPQVTGAMEVAGDCALEGFIDWCDLEPNDPNTAASGLARQYLTLRRESRAAALRGGAR